VRTTVTRTFTFEAAHQLPWHTGACRELHGHGYRIEVTVGGRVNDDGIIIDFADIGDAVGRTVLSRYDHRYLNDILDNPTAELIAQDAWKQLEAAGLQLVRIRLWETADSFVEVERE
jgi:6-pyruvoyltetrahydropterin/6-carboxytetrahydropterin synthase